MTPGERFKTSFFKSLPIAAGALLGLLVVQPPRALEDLGWPLYLLIGLLLVAFLIGLVVLLVAANLPAKLSLRPRPNAVLSGGVGALVAELRAHGFTDIGPPFEIGTTPPGLLVGFTHKDHPVYATVFQPGQRGTSPMFDFGSILNEGRGALITAAASAAGFLPARRTLLRQIFRGMSVGEAFTQHKKALGVLRGRGLRVRAVLPKAFEDDYRTAFAELRKEFFRRPVRHALVTLWRSVTGKSRELGLVTDRPRAAAVIDELSSQPPPQ